ncbi:hypothetical protein [Curtobacterium sp. MCSS17_016]|uniref:hypothetical protein n=1 Tax=Curtobacterium sp. MCSS17_016 TaxID=2175644 RepID=UPI000DA7F400|nr:hypothetical protein [Curtobacterium sp. MCSS17_016]WIE81501.1 hypothetical protein DEJ19_019890 [Curtobacterium sp. MCSS17_016]
MSTPAAADGYPQVGSDHKNGDRMFGIFGDYARVLEARGTPKASSLHKHTATPLMLHVRIGDELRIEWDGKNWWASSPRGTVGRITWSAGQRGPTEDGGGSAYDFDDGVMHVQTITVNRGGAVVDCGGYVVPDGHVPHPAVVPATAAAAPKTPQGRKAAGLRAFFDRFRRR